MKIKLNTKIAILTVFIVVSIFFLILFGLEGFKSYFFMAILFFLPMYLIIDLFELKESEKMIFAFALSLGIYPSLVYWIGFILPFNISVYASFVLLIVVWYIIKKLRK